MRTLGSGRVYQGRGPTMNASILNQKNVGLIPFVCAFALLIACFKFSSLFAEVYFQWTSLFSETYPEGYNLWLALLIRFTIPALVGLLLGILFAPDMRASVTAGAFFGTLFLVWPAFLYFDIVIVSDLWQYRYILYFFYGLYLAFFTLAVYGGFALGTRLVPLLPRFKFQTGEVIKLSVGRHILLPIAISLAGNLITSTVLRDFVLRVLGSG